MSKLDKKIIKVQDKLIKELKEIIKCQDTQIETYKELVQALKRSK